MPSPLFINSGGESTDDSFELRLASVDSDRFEWLVGAMVFDTEKDLFEQIGAPGMASALDASTDLGIATLGEDAAHRRLEPWTVGLAHWHFAHCGIDALEAAWRELSALPARFAQLHARCDVLLTPVVRTPPPPLGRLAPDRDFEALFADLFDWMSYTPVQNLAGTPAIALPLSRSAQGLPVGVQFAADRGAEDILLALGYELEAAAHWQQAWPPLSTAGGAQHAPRMENRPA